MRALALLLIATGLHAQEIQFKVVEREVIQQRFARLQPTNVQRADVLRQLFQEAGCDTSRFREQPVKRSKLPNLICTLPGTTSRTIVVLAHYDKVKDGQGAIDNWSGASMVPSLFESLSAHPRTVTFQFVVTTDEEVGLVGSTEFVRQLSTEQRKAVIAAVNIDSVGLPGRTHIWVRRANKDLVNAAGRIANLMQIGVDGVNVDEVGDSDSHPFSDAHIPVIDFHSINSQTLPLLHSAKDVPAAVDPASYYDTFRLLSGFLAYLDAQPRNTP